MTDDADLIIPVEAGRTYEVNAQIAYPPIRVAIRADNKLTQQLRKFRPLVNQLRRQFRRRGVLAGHQPRPLPIDGAAYRRRRNRRTK